MALYYELPVYRDTYKLILMLYRYTHDFPREYKYTLGQDIKRDSLQLVRGIYRVNKASDKEKHFYAVLDDFEMLKFQIRLCTDLKLLSIHQQAELVELSSSIGRQLTAWSQKYKMPESHS
ncbi:MAG: four helix bundle protein [Bacteroidales bacterium]|nr:four helix bundle protein [Bacteroidales bacterium]